MAATDPRARSDWVSLLRSRADAHPDRLAYTFLSSRGQEAERWTYQALEARARAIAAAIAERGAAGQPVLLVLPSSLEYVAAFFGCLFAGAIAVPVLPPRPNRPDHRLRGIARDCGAKIAVTTARLAPRMAEALPEGLTVLVAEEIGPRSCEPVTARPESLAFLQYTSGSTGDPKGVRISHAHLMANQRMMAQAFDTNGDFSVVGWLPLHHDMGLIGNVLHALYQGAPCVLMAPETFLMRPVRWLEAIERYRGTTSGAPNFAYDLCVDRIPADRRAELDLSSWRVAYNGAEPVRQSTLHRFSEAFAVAGFSPRAFCPCYGLAEATLLVCAADVAAEPTWDEDARVCCGSPPEGTRVRIVDPRAGAPRPDGEEGEVWVSGPSVAGGYFGRTELTRQTFEARLDPIHSDQRTYLRTGDLGYIEGGRLFVTGRSKDLIILAGRNYHPQDVEAWAEQASKDVIKGGAAAFSVEHEDRGRVVLVLEIHRRAADQSEQIVNAVRTQVMENLEIAVDDIRLIRQGTLPRTTSGKVRRHACRNAYLRGDLIEIEGSSS